MNATRAIAFRMRTAGNSYNEINVKLGIPKSTLSSWFRNLVLSDDARTRLTKRVRNGTMKGLVKRNKMQTHLARQKMHSIRESARKVVPTLKKRDLLLLGALLYWAEGYKRPLVRDGKELTAHSISFVNADAEMIRAFIKFLTEILEIDKKKIVLAMRLYPHINEKEANRHWLGVTELAPSNFRKTTYLISGASKLRRPFNRLSWGTLQVSVYNTDKFHYLIGLISGVKHQFRYGRVFQLPG